MRSTCTLGAAALLVVLGIQPVAAQKDGARRAFTPDDWYRVTTVSDAALSPDGKLVAFTVTTVNEKANKRHSEVWVAPTTGCPAAAAADIRDETFRDELNGQPCLDFKREIWPHGATGGANPHGVLFVVPDDDLR